MEKMKFVDVEHEKPIPSTGFYVQFNPEKMQIEERVAKVSKNNFLTSEKQPKQSQTGKQNTVTLRLHLEFHTLTSFDQTTITDVRSLIRQFYRYTEANEQTAIRKVAVLYGSMSIVGFITSFSVVYTAFHSDGKAVSAEVDLTIEGNHHGNIAPIRYEQNDHTRIGTTSFAESLKAYGSAIDWKQRAQKNDVSDPLLK